MNRHLIASILFASVLGAPLGVQASDTELSFETTTFSVSGPSYDLFDSDLDYVPSNGLRLGYAVHDRVALIGGWQHGARGQTVFTDMDYEDEGAFHSAFYADEFTLGAKADWPVADWFRPYATVQALGILGMVRLDDDTSLEGNVNEIQGNAFAPGGVAAGGLDFRVPIAQGRFAIASYLEFGYGYAMPLEFDELGDIKMRGFVFRWGIGGRI